MKSLVTRSWKSVTIEIETIPEETANQPTFRPIWKTTWTGHSRRSCSDCVSCRTAAASTVCCCSSVWWTPDSPLENTPSVPSAGPRSAASTSAWPPSRCGAPVGPRSPMLWRPYRARVPTRRSWSREVDPEACGGETGRGACDTPTRSLSPSPVSLLPAASPWSNRGTYDLYRWCIPTLSLRPHHRKFSSITQHSYNWEPALIEIRRTNRKRLS